MFQPGKSGNPQGGRKDKVFADAVRTAINEYAEEKDPSGKKQKNIRVLARKLVKMATKGDMAAMREIADRLDGKSVAVTEHAGPDGKDLNFVVTFRKAEPGEPMPGEDEGA